MATYTMPLKAIIEQPTQNRNDLTLKQRLEVGRVNLFKDIDYPIFNENYRSEFESKFIRYFYNKEIGFETESLFKFELETWLQINMPYYNQLFESELLEYDPLTNIAMQFDQDLKADTTMDTTKDSQEDSTTKSSTQSSFEHDTKRDSQTDTLSNRTQNTKTDTTTDVTGHSNTDTTQDSNTTSTTDTTSNSDTHTESNTTQDAFNRKIDSDTPDNRLNLSSNEGSGVIEYASNIAETKDKSTGDTVTDTNTADVTNSNTSTIDKTTSNSQTDTTENTVANSNQDVTENTTSNSVTGETTKQTGWDHSQTDGTGQIIGSVVGRDVGNKLENLYNERYGKDGTITYQQMIQELRATFLRIERQIFREMTELFMLLY